MCDTEGRESGQYIVPMNRATMATPGTEQLYCSVPTLGMPSHGAVGRVFICSVSSYVFSLKLDIKTTDSE